VHVAGDRLEHRSPSRQSSRFPMAGTAAKNPGSRRKGQGEHSGRCGADCGAGRGIDGHQGLTHAHGPAGRSR
jgi:hypothetical protein